jgi:CheY-like chemotaxis protein
MAGGDSLLQRILVIDDNDVVRDTFSRLLTAAGFDVVVASGGEEGLRIMRQDAAIALVLLDFDMPAMNGADVRRAQRADPVLARIPTIMVSGSSGGDMVHGNLHADDYLEKPVGREQLIAVASRYCVPREPPRM